MCDHDGAVSRSSARRRRERRLRAALRHEQLSIAMHLAQALHHSSGPRKHVDVVGSGEAFGPVLVSGLLDPLLVLRVLSSISMSLLSYLWLVLLRYLVMIFGINLSRWKS